MQEPQWLACNGFTEPQLVQHHVRGAGLADVLLGDAAAGLAFTLLHLAQCPMYIGLEAWQEGQVQPVCGAALAGAAAGVLLVGVSLLTSCLFFICLHLMQ